MERLRNLGFLVCWFASVILARGATGSWNGVAFTALNGVAQTAWNGTSISCAGGGGPSTPPTYRAQNATSGLAVASLTVSVTVTSDANSMMWAGVVLYGSGITCSGVTYNTVAMDPVDSHADFEDANGKVYLFKLAAPATGAHNLVATFAGGNASEATLAGVQLSGCAGTYGTVAANHTDNNANSTINVTSLTTDLVIDVLGHGLGSLATITATGTGQVIRSTTDSGAAKTGLRMSTTTGAAGTTTVSYHADNSTEYWATSAVAVHGL